jgi:nucleoside-diphosphate-sugar epimerase
MNRAIIIGAFGFLGYSICQAMLDEGIEVEAISVGEEPDFFIEEKRMEIGRNANFLEDEIRQHHEEKLESLIPVIIPFCDFYILEKENLLFENHFIKEELFSLSPEKYSILLLLPEQLEYEGSPELEPLVKFKKNLGKKGFLLKEVLVPTLFGPWQPDGCFFQQILSLDENAVKVPALNPRESTSDAIYIADAAIVIRGLLDEDQAGKYVIRSGVTNSWYNCLKNIYENRLNAKEQERKWINDFKNMMKSRLSLDQTQKLSKDYHRVYVKKPTEIFEGLEQQWKQYVYVSRGIHD